MASEPRPASLDRPLARGVAFLVFLGCIGAIVWLERGRLFPPEVAADDPVALCIAERSAQIDDLVASGRIQAGQAEVFKSRARDMCANAGAPAGPPPPGQPPR
jgi:hypothetical protein